MISVIRAYQIAIELSLYTRELDEFHINDLVEYILVNYRDK